MTIPMHRCDYCGAWSIQDELKLAADDKQACLDCTEQILRDKDVTQEN